MDKKPPPPIFLTQWRDRCGLTQEKLAALIDVHKGTVSRWESGKRDMDMADVQKIAIALGIEPMALFRSPADHDAAKLIDRFARYVDRAGIDRASKLLDAVDDEK